MKKKVVALVLTLIMACSFCMTSCATDISKYEKKAKSIGYEFSLSQKIVLSILPTPLSDSFAKSIITKAETGEIKAVLELSQPAEAFAIRASLAK